MPDRDDRFFLKTLEGGKFGISAVREGKNTLRIPVVFFHWISSKQKRGDWSFSPTAGLGVTDDRPAVFAGAGITYNQNLSLMLGVGGAGRRVLNGKYTEGQQLSESLTDDQLHERVFRPSPMVALAFRFGANPFATADAPATPPAAPAAAGDTAAAKPNDGASGTTGASATPVSGGTPLPEASREADIKLRFDAQGRLRDPSVLTALLERAPRSTHIFIVSHGWWNDESSADCFYRRMIGGIQSAKPPYLTAANYAPLFVSIYWPSAVFPMEPSDCNPPPQPATPRRESTTADPLSADAVRHWASSAFPDAATRSTFEAQLARATSLLQKERGAALTDAESDELASTLVDFNYDTDTSPASGIHVSRIVASSYGLDYTLFSIADDVPAGAGRLYFSTDWTPASDARSFVIIQHPSGSPKHVSIADCILGDARRVGVQSGDFSDFGHECDTLGGSSGSPVLDYDTGAIVGLHHFGFIEGVKDAMNQAVVYTRVLTDIERQDKTAYAEVALRKSTP